MCDSKKTAWFGIVKALQSVESANNTFTIARIDQMSIVRTYQNLSEILLWMQIENGINNRHAGSLGTKNLAKTPFPLAGTFGGQPSQG